MPHRRELYFWRLSTGIALALAGVLALRGTVAHTKPQPVVEAHRQSRPIVATRWLSRERRAARRRSRNAQQRLSALKNARAPSDTCIALSSLATENGSDELAITTIADFSTPAHSMLLRNCAIAALGAASSEAATSFLIDLAEDPEISIRLGVVDALAGRQDSGARRALLDAARSPDHELSVRAALALAQAGAAEAVPLLTQALSTESGDTAMLLIAALGSTKTPEAATPAP